LGMLAVFAGHKTHEERAAIERGQEDAATDRDRDAEESN
jgi:hypothetical protein